LLKRAQQNLSSSFTFLFHLQLLPVFDASTLRSLWVHLKPNHLMGRKLIGMVLLFAAFYLTGRVGLALPQVGSYITLVWAPTGIALAALLRLGLGMWLGVLMASIAVNLFTVVPPWVAVLIAVGNTVGPTVSAWILHREGLHVELDQRRDLWRYVVIGVCLSMVIAATNGVFWLCISGLMPWREALKLWQYWWSGGAIGALVVGVPLLTVSQAAMVKAFGGTRWATSVLLATATVLSPLLATLLVGGKTVDQSPWFFVPHLLLCWLAARSGLFVASVTALLLIIATMFTTLRSGVTFDLSNYQEVWAFLGYMASLLVIPLITTALTGEIAANERRWQVALDISHIGVGDWSLPRAQIELSKRWLELLGHTAQSFDQSVGAFWGLLHADDMFSMQRALEKLRSPAVDNFRQECRMRCRDGSWRLFEFHALVADRHASGDPVRIMCTGRDISELQATRERQELVQSAFQHLHEGLLITDPSHRVIEANPTFTKITGYTRSELIGVVPPLLQPAEPGSELAAQQAAMNAALTKRGSWRGDFKHQLPSGEPCMLQLSVIAVRNAKGRVRNHVLAIADITQAHQQFEQLQRQAHFDELTRLPNRVRLAQMLHKGIQISRSEGSLLTVCYLDLDHFKPVNDRYGHEAGDRLLLELANRMRRSLRSWAEGDDVAARIGGDEFVLLLRTASLEESRRAVERVLKQICQPYNLGAGIEPVLVTASIGATVFPLDDADPDTLMRHADHAMYGAKQSGRNGYLFFDAELDKRTEARFVALGRVQEALDAQEFCLYFQPEVDMERGKVLGVEALLRWRHPERGVISPAQFLPLIENTGLSISVGNWVLQRGIEQLALWLRAGLDLSVSINVSARHLQEPLFAQHLASLLSKHQAPVAQHLILEVLETTALADVDYTCALIQKCKAMGVRFALDDFGTGYSTFTYLKRLPLDMLKIDRSFVTNMLSDRQDLAIVEGVIGLSQTFDCTVIAEGVETQPQAQRLIQLGCHVGQGNGIAPAMPAEDVADWVKTYKGMPLSQE
jgi:diguanylate cyclase (GGDEF)-like protein/PAS domain S-box-containing protein